MVNGILQNQDRDNDGYVNYFEFQEAQKKRGGGGEPPTEEAPQTV